MKRIIIIAIVCMLTLTGCGNSTPKDSVAVDTTAVGSLPTDDVFEIREKMFIAQINDVYYNPSDYMGKMLKYEGVFDAYTYPETGQTFYSVIRYGPGCCGDDGNVGFEIKWDGKMPKQNDWVEVVGKVEAYKEGDYMYLRLGVERLDVLSVRGNEVVSQ